MIQKSKNELVIFTPYFNLPKVINRDLIKALRRGVKVTITVGDKTANDFYIAESEKFSTIGIIPYIYEILLVRFVKRWRKYIEKGLLEVRLWKDETNSFHLKGLISDNRYHLITGSNINPRAWALDLENGLLIDDKKGLLIDRVEQELETIYKNTTIVSGASQLETIKQYPAKPQKLLKRLRLAQIDRLLKRLL
jgi:CDP-diacylglycerol--serine O-phosphatidyltransferase